MYLGLLSLRKKLYQSVTASSRHSSYSTNSTSQRCAGQSRAPEMTDRTILIVEDDPKIRKLLHNVLEDAGHIVLEAADSVQAHEQLDAHHIDLITLDLNLGADSGLDLLRDVRSVSSVAIIMITGKDDVIDRVVGLELGADDYITKPFHVREVLARVNSVLRRRVADEDTSSVPVPETVPVVPDPTSTQYQFDGMIAAPDRFELTDRSGANVDLTSGDFNLLAIFLERPKRVLSRDQLMTLIGGLTWSPLDRTVDNQVARLRKKIERDPSQPKLIKTVRGVGYTFASDVKKVQGSGEAVKSR